jgi:hypothetical protein
MAQRAEITSIARNGRHSTYERITHVCGGVDKPWKLTIKEAIKLIDSGKWQFFVMRDGAPVKVEALNSRTGCRYLKTANDRYEPHDMLALPDCPKPTRSWPSVGRTGTGPRACPRSANYLIRVHFSVLQSGATMQPLSFSSLAESQGDRARIGAAVAAL